MTNDLPRLMTAAEAAQFLSIGEDTLRAMRQAGEIPYVNVGRGKLRETPRYDPADLEAWIEKNKTRVPQHSVPLGKRRRKADELRSVIDFKALRRDR